MTDAFSNMDAKDLQNLHEIYDAEVMGRSQIRKMGDGGRVAPKRQKGDTTRSAQQKTRLKAIGGGRVAAVGPYKDRKDIGSVKPRSAREQQPEKERGSSEVKQSYEAKAKEERKAAARARIAAKKGQTAPKAEKPKAKETEKKASELLKKKTAKPVDPRYKPQERTTKKPYTEKERMSLQRKGETKLRGIFKDQETDRYKKETGTNPDKKGRTKILARVHQRMSS